MIRLFIAWPLPSQVEQELGRIIQMLRQKGGRINWVVPQNIHLTARFLGDTDQRLLPALKLVIDHAASQLRKVNLMLDKVGTFPNMKRPHVIWAGLAGDMSTLQQTVDTIERGVQELGFSPESKRFKPHLTLGRVKDPHGVEGVMTAAQQYRMPQIAFTLDRLVLFKSTLSPQGSIYERLYERVLGAVDRIEG